MNTEIAEVAMTTLATMTQAPEKFSSAEIKNFYEVILMKLPCIVIWKDKDFKYVFCNQISADLLSLSSPSEIIGKTDFDLGFNVEAAKSLRQTDEEIVKTGKPALSIETTFTMGDGRILHLSTNRTPLFNSANEVIGIIGISVDLTAQKEAERREAELRRLERDQQLAVLQEKENYAKLARKVAHDINSPLAALNMMLEVCNELPEDKRSFFRRATESILDIANNLLTNNDKEENLSEAEFEFREPLLVSDLLIHLLSEKKVQYHHHSVKFETVIAHDAQFAFIQIQKTEFRRAMSNLINNAVDALEDKEKGARTNRTVTIQISASNDFVLVKVQDNGKGMRQDQVDKITTHQGFTEGKENGHGLGLQQVWDMLECNEGTMAVESELGKGTSIQLAFPRIDAPNWIAQEIHLSPETIIVMLDDDESVRQVSRRNNYFALKRDDKVRCAVNGSLLTQARRVTAWSEAVGTT